MIPGKTDKQLVWEALKHIEDYTSGVHPTFDILPETLWIGYSKEDKLRIRALLLSSGLVSLVGTQQWAFQLTAAGMLLKESELLNDGSLKRKKSYEQFWLGVLTAMVGTVLGASLSYIQDRAKEQFQIKHPTPIVYHPTIQVLHDTIWLSSNHEKKK